MIVNHRVPGSSPGFGAISESLRAKCLTSSQTIMVETLPLHFLRRRCETCGKSKGCRGDLDVLKQTIVLSLMAVHRYQSGLMARSAKPLIREFKSHPMLHKIYNKYAPIVKWYNIGFVIRGSQFDSVWGHHRSVAQPGSALALGARGPRFESLYSDQFCV